MQLLIAFYRSVLTVKGMQPDPFTIQALQDLPTPDSPVKLQSFWGLINYLQPFIPGLSDKTTFLQQQLALNGIGISWQMDTALQHLEGLDLLDTSQHKPSLYYDHSKPWS